MAAKSQGKRRTNARRKAPARRGGGGGRIWPWMLALVVVSGGIAAYDNRARLPPSLSGFLPRTEAGSRPSPRKPVEPSPDRSERKPIWKPPAVKDVAVVPSVKPETRPVSAKTTAAPTPPATVGAPIDRPTPASLKASADGKGHSGQFYYCGTSGLDNCVSAGDTFWFHKSRITLADAVAPETEKARCQQERDLGFAAKVRLRDLLNGGGFDLAAVGSQGHLVARNGRSIGSILISEGLAKPRGATPAQWCR